jgi:hypothetical protein
MIGQEISCPEAIAPSRRRAVPENGESPHVSSQLFCARQKAGFCRLIDKFTSSRFIAHMLSLMVILVLITSGQP